MADCPRCQQDQMYRVHRSVPERILFAQSFECRFCGHRSRVTHAWLSTMLAVITLQRRRRVGSRPDSSKEH
jgi:hypothetical protein